MVSRSGYDAVVVGSGPNGLAAAIRLAQAGARVIVLEARSTIGGGTRTVELTLPGFLHDVCSAIHPLGLASPFLRSLPLEQFGLEYIQPTIPLAHPLDDDRTVFIHKSLEETAEGLGPDGPSYRSLMKPLVDNWQSLMQDFLGPFPIPPNHPLLMARFGLRAIRSARGLAQSTFQTERARAAFAGMSGHSILPLDQMASGAFGLMLGTLAHAVGWPLARGGSRALSGAMAKYLDSLEGEISTGWCVEGLDELPASNAVLFALSPKRLLDIAGDALRSSYRWQLERFEYGPGVCKVDWALDGPIPWSDAEISKAGTVHLGGSMDELVASERQVWQGDHPEKPYVLLAQQSLFDPSRAPQGKHTAWAYCHVPNGSSRDVSAPIERQVERFAPGFRDRILDRHVYTASDMESYNANYVGGDINGGVQNMRQLFTRPAIKLNPYRIPTSRLSDSPNLYLCSSSTPPGGGVHGMCGYYAAEVALNDLGVSIGQGA